MSARSLDLLVHGTTYISTLLVGLTPAEHNDVIYVKTCWEALWLPTCRALQEARNAARLGCSVLCR